jgi:hypothetical protein
MPHPRQVCVETKRKVLVCAHIHCLQYRYCKYCKITDKSCMIYLLTAIGLTPGGSSTVHIYTQYVEQHNENRIYRTEHT